MKQPELTALYRYITNHVEAGIHAIDVQGKTLIYNDKMRQLKGISSDERMEQALDARGQDSLIYHVLKTEQPIKNHRQNYWLKSGEEFVTLSDLTPVYQQQTLIGAVEITRDITEQELLAYQPLRRYGKPLLFETITAVSKKMARVIDKARMAAENQMPVLLYGESGAGTDLIAEGIHHASTVKKEQFVTLICRHDEQALLSQIAALFDEQQNVTVFCERLEYLSLEGQQRLLELFERHHEHNQFIASVGDDPIDLISEQKLLKELYYFFASVCVRVPALRERKEDIQPFIDDYFKRYRETTGSQLEGLSERVEQLFMDYEWPGNLKELEILLDETMSTVTNERQIDVDQLPMSFRWKVQREEEVEPVQSIVVTSKQDIRPLTIFMQEMEEYYIKNALELFDGNVSQAAKALDIRRQSLQYRLKKFED
ncbi:sigma-54-dependent Fis family transcriptional regulator [Kurthia huakuii]|uniref:sigma-54-dependent Fis family transcriptional regulator n=1 Tax=Kurthia huakuii TaxID=1421019 RepID=UPI0004968291|nr:sigma-54-dependent Fis family transcriptional regulator [Kurthia huakuii]MBM7698745.1 arginine utilization regulatory protein [Kurthia huakuii]